MSELTVIKDSLVWIILVKFSIFYLSSLPIVCVFLSICVE